ncbi:ABC transporter [Streptomyces alfalfae]|uniref:ABC transporter n=1 Tax=Streptomyces alfalfae TaxID=1642299 RepID=A0ABN4VUA2_9ACTN|nr:ATP-binding cassette domain-containing protein [Streptomyces alfalfae]AYA21039.1 ATP-binding cassette domain-containing protein [Streptomyces fradiae]APY90724.1 ABC transporter [Streptomyces alfalfae]QUI34469.1 ATP-binding cassette domain-containing protein [Streptomyces alfalfae]RXX39737.1 ABC transporter [Streptomyces alfalfae]RZM84273.1 ATP-binding cassette domain-containing protein [Streptomyces alfalfae]
MERDPVLRLSGVGRRYGLRGPWVLRGVDLGIRAGALIRVQGGNGTGKSTLLRLLAGVDAPSEGRLTQRPRTAFVPERFPAALPFTAVGYLTHLARVHGLARGAAGRSAERWLERFGAGGHARTPLSELSKGGSQKVAVAQALLADPELLVLDEAWTGLDVPARAELDRAVAERTAAGGSVVFVDHDPRRLADVADETYAVVGGGLERRTEPPGPEGAGPRGPVVVIVAQGPPGAALPAPVAAVAVGVGAGGAAGATRLTVPESRSDLVLRELLTARVPWHVVRVEEPGAVPSPTSAPAAEEGTSR